MGTEGEGLNRDMADENLAEKIRSQTLENLALVGFMGSGKSTVGGLLATRLGMEYVDLDDEVSRRAGMDIPAIFEREGEEGFRQRESLALREVLTGGGKVVACGGGVVLRDENLELLRRRALVVYLEVSEETAVSRLGDGEGRPLLAEGDIAARVGELMARRRERYHMAAHEVVKADRGDPEEMAEEIAGIWRRYRSGSGAGNTPSM